MFFALAVLLCGGPRTACALTVERCTARSNADDETSDVMGGSETRVTWEATLGVDEGLRSLSLTLPENTAYRSADTRVVLLTGRDFMTRTEIGVEVGSKDQTLTLSFPEPINRAGKLNIQIYGVIFPAAGGQMQLTGSETNSAGSKALSDIPAITVVGVSPFEQAAQFLSAQPWVRSWNSNKFLRLFANPMILVTSFPVVLQGFLMSLAIAAISFPLAIPCGLLLAIMRRARSAVLRGIATTYVNIVRGTPMFLQIYIAFFGLPLAGVQVAPFALGIIVMFMNSGAYLCEIFRAGIASIDIGQGEAARSLGMTRSQTMVDVIVPQMFRAVIPNLTNEFILLYKDTSLLAAVGTMELVMYAKTIVANTGSITPYIVAAAFYLVITLPLSKITRHLERRVSSGRTRRHRSNTTASGDSARVAAS
ncbi:amino acid ABC transporter membrane protein, PAAT family [Coriobacterium glomerans PW2]|uniref:Amino acid ABC transporter membrane protein, PAAT family n=2 Tax=Coriobacterium TaxID=33870 RepID=F2N8W3_CORGP|nr:amino acid ABC transporter membrane protein, PAAT family [Coriobacterium glomerans PW2]